MQLAATTSGRPTMATAKAALNGYRRQGHVSIDSASQDQIEAYMTLRESVHRVTAETFMRYLETRQSTLTEGASAKAEFWAVPKCNFKELPHHISDAIVEPVNCRNIKVDRERFHIVDMVIPRQDLGKNVWRVSNYLQTATSGVTGSDQPQAVEDDSRQPPAVDPHEVVSANTRGLKRNRSEIPGPPECVSNEPEPPSENPEVKRARAQLATLTMLRTKMVDANKKGKWVHREGSLSPDSVLHWVEQTAMALEELAKEKPDDANMPVKPIVANFVTFLVGMILKARCYPDLHKFKGILPRLLATGGDSVEPGKRDEARLIEQLASIGEEDSSTVLDVKEYSVFVTTSFFLCNCYCSFVEHRGHKAVSRAIAATDNRTRVACLEPLKGLDGLPPSLAETIEVACRLFDPEASLADVATYVWSSQPQAAKLAISWDPTGSVGAVARLLQDTMPPFDGVSYANVVTAVKALVAAELVLELPNPAATQAVCFVHDGIDQPQAAIPIAASALSFRLGTTVTVEDMGPPDPASLPTDCAMKVYKRTQTYFSSIPKAGKFTLPEWFQKWKASIEADSIIKKKGPATAAAGGGHDCEGGPAASEAEDDANAPDAAAIGCPTATGVDTSVTFVRGDKVAAKIKQKTVDACVNDVLKSHCWVTVVEDQGVQSGRRMKVLKTRLSHIEPSHKAGETVVANETEEVEEKKEEYEAWMSCASVFGSD